jgi:hypothetical protein
LDFVARRREAASSSARDAADAAAARDDDDDEEEDDAEDAAADAVAARDVPGSSGRIAGESFGRSAGDAAEVLPRLRAAARRGCIWGVWRGVAAAACGPSRGVELALERVGPSRGVELALERVGPSRGDGAALFSLLPLLSSRFPGGSTGGGNTNPSVGPSATTGAAGAADDATAGSFISEAGVAGGSGPRAGAARSDAAT